MLMDVLTNIVTSDATLVVAGSAASDEDLLMAVRRTRADVVLVGQKANDETCTFAPLLLSQPKLKVLAIADDADSGLLYDLRPYRKQIGKLSADALLDAIRGPQVVAPDIQHE
jgi:hypothetical protein